MLGRKFTEDRAFRTAVTLVGYLTFGIMAAGLIDLFRPGLPYLQELFAVVLSILFIQTGVNHYLARRNGADPHPRYTTAAMMLCVCGITASLMSGDFSGLLSTVTFVATLGFITLFSTRHKGPDKEDEESEATP